MKYPAVSALALSFLFCACEKKPQVVEKPVAATQNFETARLGAAIDAYAAAPSPALVAEVERAFAEVDGEIAELDERAAKLTGAERAEASTKASDLKAYRAKELLRYTEAQARAKASAARDEAKDAGERIEESARRAGEEVKEAAENVKEGAEKAVDRVKDALP